MPRATTDTPIVPYRSGTANAVPASADMQIGEIALNYADAKLFTKRADGVVVQIGGSTGGAAALTSKQAQLAANVTMANISTFYDGPSLTLETGTWLINAVVSVRGTANALMRAVAKLWNGTTTYASAEQISPAGGAGVAGQIAIPLTYVLVVTAASVTVKVSATSSLASSILASAGNFNTTGGNTATTINAVKIA